MATIRISDDNNEALKEIKREYDLPNIDKVLELTIKNTPLPVNDEKEPPAFVLKLKFFDGTFEEKRVSWSMLKNSKQGDIFKIDCNSCTAIDYTEGALILFKDDDGILIKFEKNYFDGNPFNNIWYYSFI
nr:hypothetical protein [Methanobrevibacter arboriphilus]